MQRNNWYDWSRTAPRQNPQGDLFTAAPEAPEPEEHPLLSALRDLQPDEMSPKEALERLYRLKRLV